MALIRVPAYGDVVDITTSGTASAPITFEAAPGQTPVINSSGTWNGIHIEASNIVINGFTVVGDAANYTLPTALAGYGTGNANLDGNGITVKSPAASSSQPHHDREQHGLQRTRRGHWISLTLTTCRS